MRRWMMAGALSLAACGQGGQAQDKAVTTSAPGAPAPVAYGQSAATAAAGMPVERREFRDWTAVCNNVNDCWAYAPIDEGDMGWLLVSVPAGPQGRPRVDVGFWPEDAPGAIAIRIDGRTHDVRFDNDAEIFTQTDGLALARAMAAGQSAEVTGGEPRALSLSGAAAAMLWIDERQGRLDTVTALVRRGDRAAGLVPAPPAPPQVMRAPAVDQTGFGGEKAVLPAALEALPAVKTCREETAHSDWLKDAAMSARLDASTELWAVPCFAGAYNIGHDWYVTGPNGADPKPAVLAAAIGEASAGTINGDYSPETRSIVAFAKGRGPGDCGTASTWTWSGRAFVLTEESEMTDCMGMPPDFWPVTWRSAN